MFGNKIHYLSVAADGDEIQHVSRVGIMCLWSYFQNDAVVMKLFESAMQLRDDVID